MRDEAISVTDAARNFSECINRARYQGTTFILLKNGLPVARIVPAEKKRNTGRELAAALREVRLAPEESAAWRKDLERGRASLVPQKDKWQ